MKKLIPTFLKNIYRNLSFEIACLYFGVNTKSLRFIGVTGTSGKTTTSSMIFHVLNNCGVKVGLISTVGALIGHETIQTGFHVTTPDPVDLVRFIKLMQDRGVEYVVLETSSHALAQNRIGNLKFDFAVYTNITNDHLDWHKSWENYAKSKAKLIEKLKDNGVAVLNKDDSKSYEFLSKYVNSLNKKRISYSLNELENKSLSLEGVKFQYKKEIFNIKILGEYNISNALASIKVAEEIGVEPKKIAKAFSDFKTVQGRMEIFQLNPFAVILDFAHNADSLEKSLQTAKKLARDGGRLISVFGSAGLRDINKRFDMGRISGDIADITIVTAEDPRTEKLFNINSEIINGLQNSGPKLIRRFSNHSQYEEFLRELSNSSSLNQPRRSFLHGESGPIEIENVFVFDEENVNSRYDAIDLAIKIAKPGDVIITNGKGHERSLAFGVIEHPFSDADALNKSLGKF